MAFVGASSYFSVEGIVVRFYEVLVFFCFGVAFLYAVCLLEEMDEFGDHGHSHGHGHKEEVHVEEAHAHHEEARHDHHSHHSHHDHGHGHGHHEL